MMNKLLFVFLALFILGFTLQSDREAHEVQPGETLFSISQQYNVSVDDLQEWNNLDDASISVGQEIYVEDEPEAEVDQEELEEYTHTVSAGETMFSISQIYDVNVDDIIEWNELESPDLNVDQELTIYSAEEVEIEELEEPVDIAIQPTEPGLVDPDALADAEETEASTHQIHTVRRGETIYRIAGQYNMSVDDLIDLNDELDQPDDIESGQQLKVHSFISMPSVLSDEQDAAPQGAFYTYRYSESESIDEILGHNHMDKSEFLALNPGKDPDNLEDGDMITLIAPGSDVAKNPYRIESGSNGTLDGLNARVYDDDEIGTSTTSGDLYNPDHLTAAHSSISMGTIVYLENPINGKGVFVLINDRTTGSGIKVSRAVKEAIDLPVTDDPAEVLLSQID